jgi:hypothetical protein
LNKTADIEEWNAIQKSGASMFRVPITPEWTSNGNSWAYYDGIFGLAAERGVTILPILQGRLDKGVGLPASGEKAGWEEWAKKVVRRYGYNGVYWSTHPGIPAKPVVAWEMWNEPNNATINGGQITAGSYGAFLAWAGAAVQTASQSWGGQATGVLFGGLLAWSGGTSYQTYLKNAYAVPGASGAFTGLAFHPYALDTAQFPGKTRLAVFEKAVFDARSFLNSLGAGGKSLWITETGWPAEAEYGVGEPEQANLLRQSFNWVKINATALDIRALIWFNYRDTDIGSTWQYRCGLRTRTGVFRPAWFAFQEQTGAPKWPVPLPRSVMTPSAFISADGTEHVYVTTGGGINHYLRSPGFGWGGEIVATGSFTSAPAALAAPNGTENVYIRTEAGLNRYARSPGGQWGGEVIATLP